MDTNPTAIAQKATIREIIEGVMLLDEQFKVPFLQTVDLQKKYRVRVAGIILQKEQHNQGASLLIDDGTGTLVIRCFEDFPALATLDKGKAVLCLGRARLFQQEKYIAPDLLKEIAPAWLRVYAWGRALPQSKIPISSSQTNEQMSFDQKEIPQQKIVSLIKNLDQGEGVILEELLEKSPLSNTEKIVQEMMQRGEIFQLSPGKVKLL